MQSVSVGPPWAEGGAAPRWPRRVAAAFARWLAAWAAFAYLWTCRRVGARARTLGRPLVRNAGRIEIGADVLIESRPERVELAAVGRGRLIIGSGVRIGPGARLTASRYVEVGDRVRIGARCVVADDDTRATPDEAAGIWIGDAVTLGEGVVVAPGTVIGAGAVVAPRCTVAGHVPPFAVVDGAAAVEPGPALREPPLAGAALAAPSAR